MYVQQSVVSVIDALHCQESEFTTCDLSGGASHHFRHLFGIFMF